MPQLVITQSGKSYLTDKVDPPRRHDARTRGKQVRFQCKTCKREYSSFMEFTFQHGDDCACPCMTTWEA